MNNYENKCCYIVSNQQKKEILNDLYNQKKILDIKVLTLQEILNKIEFSYSSKTIYYLINKYNFNYEIALNLLKSMKYIQKKEYGIKKLDYLVKLKQELKDNNLVEEKFNLDKIKQYKIKLYNSKYIDKYYINLLSSYFDIEKVEDAIIPSEKDIYKFETKEQEITFVFDKIKELLENNIDINRIKLVNCSSNYISLIKRISKYYNIPITLSNNYSLYSLDSIKLFYQKLKQSKNKEESYEYFKTINEDDNLNNQVLNILNNYYFKEELDEIIIDSIKYELEHTNIKETKYKNCIEVTDLFNCNIDDYVFLINFNEGEMPKAYKDIDYLSDDIKVILNMDTTVSLNKKLTLHIVDKINSLRNIIITYKEKDYFNSYLVSPIIYNLKYKIKDEYEYNYNNSLQNNLLNLSISLDKLIKYGTKDERLNILYSNYKNINYRTYDNTFKGINKQDLYNYLNNTLTLSYSSIQSYNECAFKYYLKNILKVNDNVDSFKAKIGTIFHEILSNIYKENYNYTQEYKNKIKDFSTNKERFLATNLTQELNYVVDTIHEQEKYIELKDVLTEMKIKINIDSNININFIGIIDKLKIKKIDNDYFAVVIDYKTGSPDTSLKNINYGLNMQLPIYFYLLNRSDKFKNVIPVGMYYQKILSNKLINSKDEEKEKKDFFKLEGYSNSNTEILDKFDKSYNDSQIIKSMKTTQNGFYAYSKIMSSQEFKKLDEIIDNKIHDVINKINEADFSIDPKKIDKKNISCEFCSYKDICFKQEKDIINLKTTSLKEVLGDEISE